MALVGVDSGSLYRRTHSLSHLAWSWVGGRLAPFYIHQNEPGKLSQWLCHDDSTVNIVLELLLLLLSHMCYDSTCISKLKNGVVESIWHMLLLVTENLGRVA